MKRYFFFISFISAELLLILGIIVLGIKIKNLQNGRVKGVQHVTVIKKENLIFDKANHNLKYFYEPKPSSVEVWNPEWLGYEVKNTINADSLNERYEYPIQKADNTYRIITLGDSSTFGQNVDTGYNYSEILEDKLNNTLKCENIKKFEVINLGVYGYDIEYEVTRYIKRGVKYKPDLVIWLLNDWNFDKTNEWLLPIKSRLKNEGIVDFDPKTREYVISGKAKRELFQVLGEEHILNYQKDKLAQMKNYLSSKLVIFSLTPLKNKYKDILKDFASSNSYFIIDNLSNILGNSKYTLLDYHPNKEGHKRIAEDLFDYLRNKFFQECKVSGLK